MPTEAEVKAAKEHVRKNEAESKRINEQWNQTVADVNEKTEEGIANGSYLSREESALIDKQKKAEQDKLLTVENTQSTPDADQAIRDRYFNDFRERELKAVKKANEIGNTLADTACSLNAACSAFETVTGNRAASNTGEKLSPTERISPIKGPFKSLSKKLPNKRNFLSTDEFKKLPKDGVIDPKSIRFSQDSISSKFSKPFENQTVDDFVKALKSGSVDPSKIKPIRIVEKDGKIFTLDNRRLHTFQEAGINIPFKKLDKTPKKQQFKFTTENEGVDIIIRGKSK